MNANIGRPLDTRVKWAGFFLLVIALPGTFIGLGAAIFGFDPGGLWTSSPLGILSQQYGHTTWTINRQVIPMPLSVMVLVFVPLSWATILSILAAVENEYRPVLVISFAWLGFTAATFILTGAWPQMILPAFSTLLIWSGRRSFLWRRRYARHRVHEPAGLWEPEP